MCACGVGVGAGPLSWRQPREGTGTQLCIAMVLGGQQAQGSTCVTARASTTVHLAGPTACVPCC